MAITTYREFWPFYLRQHAQPRTRAWHYLGTSTFFLLLAGALVLGRPWLALGAVLVFYLPAWIAHFVIEGNRPATWTYPSWSFVSDVRMCALWYTGRLGREMARHGIAAVPDRAEPRPVG